MLLRRFHFRWLFGVLGAFALATLLGGPSYAAEVKLAWDANNEPDLAGYRLYYGTQAGLYTQTIDVGNAVEAEVTGLLPGTRYHFAVSAYNAAGLESELSTPVEFSTPMTLAKSNYIGLLGGEGADETLRGGFSVVLGKNGKASGKLVLAGVTYRWSGTFSATGELVRTVTRKPGLPLELKLQLLQGGEKVEGSLTDGGTTVPLTGSRTAGVPAAKPHRGRYTVVLEKAEAAPTDPYGFGLMTASAAGRLRMVATLPDGMKWAASLQLDADDSVPLFPVGKKGARVWGRFHFREVPQQSDADGDLAYGESVLKLTAARYAPAVPSAKARVQAVSALELNMEREQGSISVQLQPGNGWVGQATLGEVFTIKVVRGTGLFSGNCVLLGGERLPLRGVIYQKNGFQGFGSVTEGASMGRVTISGVAP